MLWHFNKIIFIVIFHVHVQHLSPYELGRLHRGARGLFLVTRSFRVDY
jgi:hypothetical protein